MTSVTSALRADHANALIKVRAFVELTKSHAAAIVAFLRTLPAVKHKVDGPFAPAQESTVYLMKLLPPAATRAEPGGRPDLQRARAARVPSRW